jgi:hypothetical protein
MWKQQSHRLAPLTELTKVPRGSTVFKWEKAQGDACQQIKELIGKNTKLTFPDFN